MQWRVVLDGTNISFPSYCNYGAYQVDFDRPRVVKNDSEGAELRYSCGKVEIEKAAAWGESQSNRPSAEECARDADLNAVQGQLEGKEIEIGTAWCLRTDEGQVVYAIVVDTKPGEYGPTLILRTTTWKRSM